MFGLLEEITTSSTPLVLVSVATALVGIWVWSQQKPRKDFPPGPKGWPLLGNTLVDILSGGGKDITFSQFTPTWKLHRKLSYSAFRTLATGNNERFEKLVYSILPGLTKHLESNGSKPFNPKTTLVSCIYNIIATMCFGKQFTFDGPDVKFWIRIIEEGLGPFGNGLTADYIPIMRYIPTPAVKRLKDFAHNFHGAIRKELEEHRASFDGGEPKDLLEMLLQARQELEDEGSDVMKMITEDHIIHTVADVIIAGSDTPTRIMYWSIGLLIQHFDIQNKVASEVDKVVGRDRLPCLNDWDKLPYTTATLYEVMRYSTVAPISLPHATTREVQFGGYTIPEGTSVLFNLYSMHYDEKLWDEPQSFNPEHFLDENGGAKLNPKGFMPFSCGRRVCLGESIAKAELFLLFTWLFQHFKFTKAPGMEDKDYAEGVSSGLVIALKDNDVVVEKRF